MSPLSAEAADGRRVDSRPIALAAPRTFPAKLEAARSTASPSRPRMWWPIRSPTTSRGSTPRSTGIRTIAFRRAPLWSLGLGVAEAMDTAQRGMGLDWPTSLELIRRSARRRRRTFPAR